MQIPFSYTAHFMIPEILSQIQMNYDTALSFCIVGHHMFYKIKGLKSCLKKYK